MQCSVQGLRGGARELMHHQYRNRWEKQKAAAARRRQRIKVQRRSRRVGCTRLHRTREGGLGSNDEIPAMYHIPWPASQVLYLCRTPCAPIAFISADASHALCSAFSVALSFADASDSSSLHLSLSLFLLTHSVFQFELRGCRGDTNRA